MTDTMTEDEETEEEVADSIRMMKTGYIRFVMESRKYTLRPPKLKEYMVLKTMIVDAYNEVTEAAETGKETEKADQVKMLAKLLEDGEEHVLKFMEKAFEMLSDKPLMDQDDLPVYFLSGKLQGEMLKHWRSVPLAHG